MTGFEHAAFKDLDDRVRTLEAKMIEFISQQTAHLQSLHSLLELVDGKKPALPVVEQVDNSQPPPRYPEDKCCLCDFPRRAHLGALLSCPVADVPENQVFQEEEEGDQ